MKKIVFVVLLLIVVASCAKNDMINEGYVTDKYMNKNDDYYIIIDNKFLNKDATYSYVFLIKKATFVDGKYKMLKRYIFVSKEEFDTIKINSYYKIKKL